MRQILFVFLVFSQASWLMACSSRTPPIETLNEPLLEEFQRDTVLIVKQDNEHIEFAVYVAETDEQMRQGLMFIRKLDDKVGMLFKYRRNREASMWMKNTFVALDILFIKRDGTIANIAHNTTPKSLKSIRSDGLVKGALELKAGSAKKLGIQPGDTIIHPHFRNGQ